MLRPQSQLLSRLGSGVRDDAADASVVTRPVGVWRRGPAAAHWATGGVSCILRAHRRYRTRRVDTELMAAPPGPAGAGLPVSPPFISADMNADGELNTPAVAAGHVDFRTVGRESRRKRKAALLGALTQGRMITDRELGMAACREAEAVAQVAGAAVAPPWFPAAMADLLAPIRTDILNLRATVEGDIANLRATVESDIVNLRVIMEAQSQNQRIYLRNQKAFNARAANPCPYTRPYKVDCVSMTARRGARRPTIVVGNQGGATAAPATWATASASRQAAMPSSRSVIIRSCVCAPSSAAFRLRRDSRPTVRKSTCPAATAGVFSSPSAFMSALVNEVDAGRPAPAGPGGAAMNAVSTLRVR
ncbi:unnamed protein product (mitochondrion) [Plasmodiophora brassicae]|uniref:Uncharacterized protein n=1 Tax=Plasmodiophora brassicae TaxID=37360 RepID=A0A3P3YL41_PLABS|nr:unnamed protein product [Plasmodiophora brassicae]